MRVRNDLSPKSVKLAGLQQIHQDIQRMATIKIAQRNKPILSSELELEIEASLAQFKNIGKWQEWGVDTIKKQGCLILLYGPPGTGKTVIARYLSKRIGKGMATLNMKDVGGKAPGHTERMTSQFFQDCKTAGNKTIFMDECEAIIWDRNRAGSDSMWMVGVIDEILMQTLEYRGMIIAATNKEDIIDSALKSRAFACLKIGHPEFPERKRLWKQKIPERYPVQLTEVQCERLADFNMTGRDIENAICRESSFAIVQKRLPLYTGLVDVCKRMTHETTN